MKTVWPRIEPRRRWQVSDTGQQQWMTKLEGALGGGIITYGNEQWQLLAVTYGMQSPLWPAPKPTATIVVFGL